MHHARRRLLACAAALALAATAAVPALAQSSFPNRPLRILVGASPGGGLDIVARALAQDLTKRLGQPVLVENKPGAATNIAADLVAKSPPDGYTIMLASPSQAINMTLVKSTPYDTRRDLAPVILAGSVPSVLIVGKQLDVKGVGDLTALAKARPGTLNYAAGLGTSEHLAAEMFRTAAGVKVQGVMYKGGSPAMMDLAAGHVQLMFTNLLGALPQIRGGQVKALAVTDSQRSVALPEVPTMAEAGYPGMLVSAWYGLMVPARTPPEIIARLNREAREAVNSEGFRKYLEASGGRVIGGSPEEFGAFIDGEIVRWRKVITDAGIKPE